MPVGLSASGIVGIALETTAGTYVAPTKFFPIRSESLAYREEKVVRRPIRNTADVVGLVPGNVRAEGDIEIEALPDVNVYFHSCSRATVTKTGTAAPFTYAFTPAAGALPPNKTMSITVVRNGVVFGYTGCVVSSFRYSMDGAMLITSFTMLGRNEAVQAVPTPVWPTAFPFAAGEYSIEIPTGTQICDTDNFTWTVDDGAAPMYRHCPAAGRGAAFIAFGERNTTFSLDRDFENRVEYDGFKTSTSQSISVLASKGAGAQIGWTMPVAIKDTYDVNLGGQGDLVRASTNYVGTPNAAGQGYTMNIVTSENI